MKNISSFKDLMDSHPSAQKFLIQFNVFLKKYLDTRLPLLPFKGHKLLKSSIEWGLFSEGKRFRPLLIFATGQWLKVPNRELLPWASAVEMIHTASLIHDDLPAMDNSCTRRGRPACHIKFGEDMALLAGDTLWTTAFGLLALQKKNQVKSAWLSLLSDSVGFNGLMGGQALDLRPPKKPIASYYQTMHSLKTGMLISVGIKGVLVLTSNQNDKKKRLKKIMDLIGQAFQLADDLEDKKEKSNVTYIWDRKKVKNQLYKLTDTILNTIGSHKTTRSQASSYLLKDLVLFNQNRWKKR